MVVKKIRDAASSRKKLRDTQYREMIVRLEHALSSDPKSMVWHKSLYAQFTDKRKIDRLRKKWDRELLQNWVQHLNRMISPMQFRCGLCAHKVKDVHLLSN